jgi:hypothetical protein
MLKIFHKVNGTKNRIESFLIISLKRKHKVARAAFTQFSLPSSNVLSMGKESFVQLLSLESMPGILQLRN